MTPAAVRTRIFDQMKQEHIDFMLSKIPMGRFGTVDEVAALICWLASEECSFTTGAVFDVSGGRSTLSPLTSHRPFRFRVEQRGAAQVDVDRDCSPGRLTSWACSSAITGSPASRNVA